MTNFANRVPKVSMTRSLARTALVTFALCWQSGLSANATVSAEQELRKAEQNYLNFLKAAEEANRKRKETLAARQAAREDFLKDWERLSEASRQGGMRRQGLMDTFNASVSKLNSEKRTLETERFRANGDVEKYKADLIAFLELAKQSQNNKSQERLALQEADKSRDLYNQARENLTRIDDRLNAIPRELETLKTAHEKELAALKSASPDFTNLKELETALAGRLDAYAKFPSEESVGVLETLTEHTAVSFLAALLKNPPPYVETVTATMDGEIWYEASVIERADASGDPATADELRGYRQAIAANRKELERVDELIAMTERKMSSIRARWQQDIDEEGYLRHIIEIRNRDMLAFTFVAEATAVVISAGLTAGTAAPAVYGLLEAVSKSGANAAAEELSEEALQALTEKFIRTARKQTRDQAFQQIDDYFSGKAAAFVLTEAPVTREAFKGLTGPENVLVGDFIEMLVADQGSDAVKLVTALSSGSATAADAMGLGVGLTATGAKAFWQYTTDMANAGDLSEAMELSFSAMLAQQSYLTFAAARNKLIDRRAYLKATTQAIEELVKHGGRTRQLEVKTDNAMDGEQVDKITHWSVTVGFSQQLDHPPVLHADGFRFSQPTQSEPGSKKWEFDVLDGSLPEGGEFLPLEIGISDAEIPFRFLDSDPVTIAKLGSFRRDHWENYEANEDRTHRLRLRTNPVILIIDLTNIEKFNCTKASFLSPGEKNGAVHLPEQATYFDFERQKPLDPFGPGDTLSVCTVVDGKNRQALRDEKGRMIAYAPEGTLQGSVYANGYIPPSIEQPFDILKQLVGGQNAASEGGTPNLGSNFPFGADQQLPAIEPILPQLNALPNADLPNASLPGNQLD